MTVTGGMDTGETPTNNVHCSLTAAASAKVVCMPLNGASKTSLEIWKRLVKYGVISWVI